MSESWTRDGVGISCCITDYPKSLRHEISILVISDRFCKLRIQAQFGSEVLSYGRSQSGSLMSSQAVRTTSAGAARAGSSCEAGRCTPSRLTCGWPWLLSIGLWDCPRSKVARFSQSGTSGKARWTRQSFLTQPQKSHTSHLPHSGSLEGTRKLIAHSFEEKNVKEFLDIGKENHHKQSNLHYLDFSSL